MRPAIIALALAACGGSAIERTVVIEHDPIEAPDADPPDAAGDPPDASTADAADNQDGAHEAAPDTATDTGAREAASRDAQPTPVRCQLYYDCAGSCPDKPPRPAGYIYEGCGGATWPSGCDAYQDISWNGPPGGVCWWSRDNAPVTCLVGDRCTVVFFDGTSCGGKCL